MRIEFTSEHVDMFEEDYLKAQEIASQNEAYSDIQTNEDFRGDGEDFRKIVVRGLYEQQLETILFLANKVDGESYENLARIYNALEARLIDLANQYEAVTTDFDGYETRLRMLAVKSIQVAPNKELEVNELLERKLAEARVGRGSEILSQMAEAAGRFDVAKGLFEAAGRVWPIPQILHAEEVADEVYQESEVVFIEDEMPVDPELYDNRDGEKTIKFLREKYGYTTNASVKASAFFMENEGIILTPLEIGQRVYKDSEELVGLPQNLVQEIMHKRVLSLLNLSRASAIDILHKEGYYLQYGDRRLRDNSGRQIGNIRRVYRVVSVESLGTKPMRFFDASDAIVNATDVQLDISDLEIEEAATEQDIFDIEHESMSREERFFHRLELLKKDIDEALTWLDDQGILPTEREGTISAKYLDIQLMQHRASRRTHMPQSIVYKPIGSVQRDMKMSAGAIVEFVTARAAHSALYKDFSRLSEVKDTVEKQVDRYYDAKSSNNQSTPL